MWKLFIFGEYPRGKKVGLGRTDAAGTRQEIQGKEGTKSDDSFPRKRRCERKFLVRGKWKVDEFSVGKRRLESKKPNSQARKRKSFDEGLDGFKARTKGGGLWKE